MAFGGWLQGGQLLGPYGATELRGTDAPGGRCRRLCGDGVLALGGATKGGMEGGWELLLEHS